MGREGIGEYSVCLRDHAASLRNRIDREFYRKDLKAREKRNNTLFQRELANSEAAQHFAQLATLHREALEAFGSEPPPKSRQRNHPKTALFTYPRLPDGLTHRVHFLSAGSLRRERSAALAAYADVATRQSAPNGDVLLSVATGAGKAQLFERLIESIGSDGLGPPVAKAGGFAGYLVEDGSFAGTSGWDDPNSPWRLMRENNSRASLHHWHARRGQLAPSISLPDALPLVPDSLPWDPNPRFDEILALTQTDRLSDALKCVEALPAAEREILFDEVIYLRYLTGQAPCCSDLRYLAREHLGGSAIKARLADDFDEFVECLDCALADHGPLPDDFPGLARFLDLHERDSDPLKRSTPQPKDWAATRVRIPVRLTRSSGECWPQFCSGRGSRLDRVLNIPSMDESRL